jgi:hypothetical protein
MIKIYLFLFIMLFVREEFLFMMFFIMMIDEMFGLIFVIE